MTRWTITHIPKLRTKLADEAHINDAEGSHIVSLHGSQIKNAPLLLAAPDLLEALQAVIAWAIEKEEGSSYKAQLQKPVAFTKARDAIAKASVAAAASTTTQPQS